VALTIFRDEDLTPADWAGGIDERFVFNNAIHRHAGHLVMATRIVTAGQRRITLSRLDEGFRVVPGSATAFSDHLSFADEGQADPGFHAAPADPRLFSVGARLFLHFNCGYRPVPNKIYLVEVDPRTLLPIGKAREVVREGPRRLVEKNWTFFAHAEEVFAVYCFAPLEILRVDLAQPERVTCTPAFRHEWDVAGYTHGYGEIRGGATPLRIGDRLLFVCHSVFKGALLPGGRQGLCYVAPVVITQAAPPFAPLSHSAHPVIELSPAEAALPQRPKLDQRVQEDVYPVGAVLDADSIVVSYGIHNQYAVLRRITLATIEDAQLPALRMRPAGMPAAAREPAAGDAEADADGMALRAFWWVGSTMGPRDPARPSKGMAGSFVHGNFGDLTVPHMLRRLTGLHLVNTAPQPGAGDDGPRLVTVGSVAHTCREGDVIWGTGCNGARGEMLYAPRRLHVIATRGPISREFLRLAGHDVGRVTQMFDPASLIPLVFAEEVAAMRAAVTRRDGVLLVPHYRDEMAVRRLHPELADRIQSPDSPLFAMIARMLRSELVISSSLHGLIVAEALGVPAVWLRPIMGENELKFTDYYLGTGRFTIRRADTVAEAMRTAPMPLPVLDLPAMLATFPTRDELVAHGVAVRSPPLPLGRRLRVDGTDAGWLTLVTGWGPARSEGAWTVARQARLMLHLGGRPPAGLEAVLELRAYMPGDGRPQTLRVSSGSAELGFFEFRDAGTRQIRVPLDTPPSGIEGLELGFTIGQPTSPASLGRGSTRRTLGIFLAGLVLRPAGA
jgi:predicted GH43/DUF377 family glycosyl hydrolase